LAGLRAHCAAASLIIALAPQRNTTICSLFKFITGEYLDPNDHQYHQIIDIVTNCLIERTMQRSVEVRSVLFMFLYTHTHWVYNALGWSNHRFQYCNPKTLRNVRSLAPSKWQWVYSRVGAAVVAVVISHYRRLVIISKWEPYRRIRSIRSSIRSSIGAVVLVVFVVFTA
jgi:hypothetical protein